MADGWQLASDGWQVTRGKSKGKLSETRGAEMCAKWAIFGGFGREKRGQKGVFWAPEAGKKALFAYRRGGWQAQRGFPARIGHYVISYPGPQSPPWGRGEG